MKKGIDVSTLQGRIDWSLVNADFAMLKATQGRGETRATENLRIFTDPAFGRNVVEASERGILLGSYHYFTATNETEALLEAEYFCRVLEPYRDKLKLWAAVDVESQKWLAGVGKKQLSAAVSAFIQHVSSKGFRPMLYTNPDFLTYRFDSLPDADIWLAHWNVSSPMKLERMKIWQYGRENFDGIGVCDANYGYFDMRQNYKPNDTYTLQKGDVYSNGKAVPPRLIGRSYTIRKVRKDRILLAVINSWVRI